MFLLITILIFASFFSAVIPCPIECLCVKKMKMSVECAGLKSFPEDLPRETETLSIANSFFENLHSEDLRRLYNLKELYISNTPINNIHFQDGLENLRVFLLKSTKLRTLNSIDFTGASKLLGLGISDSEINDTYITTGLEKLKFLTLFGNKLESLDSTKFGTLWDLERLGVQHNSIKSVSITSGLEHIKYLSLDNNKLTSFNSKDYKGAENLKHLSLKENDITTAEAPEIIPNLEQLSLNSNLIETINTPSILANLPKLKKLELKNSKDITKRNKIKCDCNTWELSTIKSVSGYCRTETSRKFKIKKMEKDQVACN